MSTTENQLTGLVGKILDELGLATTAAPEEIEQWTALLGQHVPGLDETDARRVAEFIAPQMVFVRDSINAMATDLKVAQSFIKHRGLRREYCDFAAKEAGL